MLAQQQAELGAQVKEYKIGFDVWLSLIIGIGFVLLGAFTIRARGLGQPGWSVTAIILGALFAIGWFWRKDYHLVLCQNGFQITKRGKTKVVLWKDISEIRQSSVKKSIEGMPYGTFHKFTLTLKDKSRVTLTNSLKNVLDAGTIITQKANEILLPEAVNLYDNSQPVKFGDLLAVSKAGLYNGAMTIPWQEVGKITVERGLLTIKRKNKLMAFVSKGVPEIPNFLVFMNLLERAVKAT